MKELDPAKIIEIEVKDGCPESCEHSFCRIETGEIFPVVFKGTHTEGWEFIRKELKYEASLNWCRYSVPNNTVTAQCPQEKGYVINTSHVRQGSPVRGDYAFITENNTATLYEYPNKDLKTVDKYNKAIERDKKIFKKPLLRNLRIRKE